MRFAGSREPGSSFGPAGHVATALRPARIAERYDTLSCALRPGFSRIGVESAIASDFRSVSGGATRGVELAISPDADRFDFSFDAAFALGLAPHPIRSAAPATTRRAES